MSKLFIYGCSFGKYGTTIGKDSDNWSDINSFGDFLSKKLNLEPVNRCWAGGSNFHIFRKVMNDIVSNNISNDDLVILQYSFIDRAWCNDTSKTVMPHYKEFQDYYKNYFSEELAFASLVSFNTYLSSKFQCKFVYSTVENLKTLQTINKTLYNDFTSNTNFLQINGMSPKDHIVSLKDSNLFLPCQHLSIEGHKLMADLYYNFIANMVE